jgi:predicted nucleic acid-binding Zn ribbon protein
MGRRGVRIEEIGNILDRMLKRMKVKDKDREVSLARRLAEERAIQLWQDVVGTKVSAHAKPINIQDKIFFVKVDNSAWCNELSFFKKDIIKKINEGVGMRVIKDVYFKT